jgi:hypothetical protein
VIRIHVDGRTYWTLRRHVDGDYIARCTKLGLSVTGDTISEVRENIATSLNLLLTEAQRNAQLSTLLSRQRWVLSRAPPAALNEVHFELPFELALDR